MGTLPMRRSIRARRPEFAAERAHDWKTRTGDERKRCKLENNDCFFKKQAIPELFFLYFRRLSAQWTVNKCSIYISR